MIFFAESDLRGKGGLPMYCDIMDTRGPMRSFPFPHVEVSGMRSPFPGMDPFIECFGLWEDFHTKLIGEMERSLSSLVPDRYVVRYRVR